MSPALIRNLTPLSNVDAAWLSMEESTNLMMVSGILVFDEPLNVERLRATIEHRLVKFDRFRQKVVYPKRRLGRPCWEFDPNFDIDNHLHRIALPEPGDKAALQTIIGDLMSTPLDYTKPLWQFHLIENYGSGCALMGRMHHSIADGIALIYVLLSLTDTEPDAPWPRADENKKGKRSRIGSALKSGRLMAERSKHLVSAGWQTVTEPSRMIDLAKLGAEGGATAGKLVLQSPDPKTIFKGKLNVPKKGVWSEAIALQDVKAIGKVTGATVNDVLLAAMTGALRRYLQSRGEEVDGLNFRAAVPVNLRPLEQAYKLGNQFGLVFLSLPVGIADPYERLVELKQRMDEIKGSAEAVVTFGILNVVGISIDEIKKIIVGIFGSKATAVMTNVPGPRQPIYFAGTQMKDIMFWVPQSGKLGLGISIISYAGKVRLGIAVDAGLVPDPETITAAFHTEFNEMMTLVSQLEQDAETEHPARCSALTKQGTQCKNKALNGSKYCSLHQPETGP